MVPEIARIEVSWPNAPISLDPQLLDRQLNELRRLPDATLPKLDDLLGDHFRESIAAVNRAQLTQRPLLGVGQHRDLVRSQRRILQQAIDGHCQGSLKFPVARNRARETRIPHPADWKAAEQAIKDASRSFKKNRK